MCARLLVGHCFSYAAVKRALERTRGATGPGATPPVTQSGPDIRDVTEYQAFWDTHSRTDP